MTMPIAGACLTIDDEQMPNSAREYRHGVHEGVDFFTGFACVDVPEGLPVLAAADGRSSAPTTSTSNSRSEQIDELLVQREQGYTDPGTLDKFRGRQVWIDHGDGIVTRYCHLAGIPEEIRRGRGGDAGPDDRARRRLRDAGVDRAGGYNKHLHFEIRVDDSFLGAGETPDETRALYEAVFGLALVTPMSAASSRIL